MTADDGLRCRQAETDTAKTSTTAKTLVTIDSHIAEWVPKDWRGKAFAIDYGLMYLAVPVAALAPSSTPSRQIRRR